MKNHQILQKTDDESQSKTNRPEPMLGRPANSNSWFRKRLDHVRSEARKEIQLKSLRPLDEK
jgi:hypothetical protein